MAPKYDSVRKTERDKGIWEYYQEHLHENLSQQEIADHFKIARSNISRILAKFRPDEKLVEN